MKIRPIPLLLSFVALSTPARAEVTVLTSGFAPITAASDLNNAGTPVAAVNFTGATDPNLASQPTINGITFTNQSTTTGLTGNAPTTVYSNTYYSASGDPERIADLDRIFDGRAQATLNNGGYEVRFTLTGLTPGQPYRLQILSGDGFANHVTGVYHTAYDAAGNNLLAPFTTIGTGSNPLAGIFTVVFTSSDGDEVFVLRRSGAGERALLNAYVLRAIIGDADADGLDDLWEDLHFGNGDGTATPAELALQDGTGDALLDNDGLTNEQEETRGTNPKSADTDNDGFHDAAETKDGTFDSYDYLTHTGDTGTDPLDDDTDNDGLPDGVESDTETYVSPTNTGTDPNFADSDSDTLRDGWEVKYGLDPNSDATPNGELDDPDSDNLPNRQEQDNGTDPKKADTDGDGVNDDIELSDGTPPTNPDPDGDGLNDGGEKTAGSNPFDPDSDDDLINDGEEVAAGSNPMLKSSVPGYVLALSGFDANTGAVVLPGNADDTTTSGSGSATLTIADWITHPSVTAISGLIAVSTGDSGTFGGFVQLQNGTAAMAKSDNVFINRNLNRDIDISTTRRGFSLTFTLDSAKALDSLTVFAGHANGTGANQSYASDLVATISGGSLTSPITASIREDYAIGSAFHRVVLDLADTVVGAGSYTLVVHMTNLPAGTGAYASFDGIILTGTPGTLPPRIIATEHTGTTFVVTATDLDPAKNYVLKRSENLTDGFPTTVDGPRQPAAATATFTDPSPAGPDGFYRLEVE